MGWAVYKWDQLSKTDKAMWIAHTRLESAAKQYSEHGEKLKKAGVELEEFMAMTPDERQRKLFTIRIIT